ncbi:helix-turn-helix transcriptional regulator [Bacillus sp. Cr_A10]|uniref:helix-turn-helix domain-containing protein n=1 Tax=Bacillus sp. Cr_A10 TaxID=3033993 RepID=UPI0023D9C527|nr:helix-turn-helix transcriptional regulator [Bacillus sp. Cr_A10]MDF2064971.1 helix-turn-helix transcriptional regulator [Bacillus sp. Cr_A10]
MNESNNFGKFLKKIRVSQKLTVRALSENSGVSPSYLSQVENGKRGVPSPEVIRKIAAALDYDYFSLMRVAGYMTVDTNKDYSSEEFISSNELTGIEKNVRGDSFSKPKFINILFNYPRIDQLNGEDLELTEEEAKERFLYLENLLTMNENIYLNSKVLSKTEKIKALQMLKLVFDETPEGTE